MNEPIFTCDVIVPSKLFQNPTPVLRMNLDAIVVLISGALSWLDALVGYEWTELLVIKKFEKICGKRPFLNLNIKREAEC